MINKQKPRPKNNKCAICHEEDCKYLEYDEELKKWICDLCKDGIEEERNKLKVGKKDIPVIEPEKNGYYEIRNGKKIWHKNEYPPNYNKEDDIEFPEFDETNFINQELDVASQKEMKIKPPSEFVMPKVDVKDGDYITLLDEGEYRTLPQDPSREVLTFKIKLPSGDEKKLSMNATSQKEMIVAWTDDSTKWVGKKCLVEIVRQKVFTQMKDVIFLHPEGGTPPVPQEEVPENEAEISGEEE